MGLFDFLHLSKQRKNYKYAQMLNGHIPVFSSFGGNIYASDVVQQACFCIVQEVKKLKPMHVKKLGQDVTPIDGRIQAVLNAPNDVMTTADLLERIAWAYLVKYNAFVIPVWDSHGKLTALWSVIPDRVTFVEDAGGRLGVVMEFADGTETTVLYNDLIHIRHHYFANDYLGGDANGLPDNEAILQTIELNDALMQGITKGVKSSYAVNGIVKYNSLSEIQALAFRKR